MRLPTKGETVKDAIAPSKLKLYLRAIFNTVSVLNYTPDLLSAVVNETIVSI